MAPEKARALATRALATLAVAACTASPAHALRIVSYNILNYPGTTAATRNPLFRTVLGPVAPDVIVAGEVLSQTGVDQFRDNVLNVLEPGQWASAPYIDGNDTDGALFYKPAKVTFLGQWGFYPNPANLLRLVHVYRIKPVGYTSGATEMRFYAVHLKASTGFEAQRAAEATGMRDSMNAVPSGTHAFGIGDFNLYRGTEPAYVKLTESQADNDGRLYDPLDLGGIGWQDSASIAIYHTQSPCLSGGATCANGAATGGMDDRFDLILPTYNFKDGTGLELLPASYVAVGNDGLHLNKNIIDAPTIPEGAGYASALILTSDHLPLRVDVSLPAILSAASSLNLGAVITGGGASYTVSNVATAPADGLTYTLSAGGAFAAPLGTFDVAAGATSAPHLITASGPAGTHDGTLLITSDAADAPNRIVSLHAEVHDHASASLDSSAIVIEDSLRFYRLAGQFSDLAVRVHNQGWDPLTARLAVGAAAITGADAARFAIVDGGPALLSDTGTSFSIRFDDSAVTADQIYQAELTIPSGDEPLPGAAAAPSLVVHLRGMLLSGVTGVDPAAPAATRLLAPFPNPIFGLGNVRFDVARRSSVRITVLDLSGRHVATLAAGTFAPGTHTVRWSGRHDSGAPAGPGVYFIRMTDALGYQGIARVAVIR